MYGMVNKALQELVTARWSDEVWDLVRGDAGVDCELFISNEGYPDEVTYRLVEATVRRTGVTSDALLFDFGEHWVLHTARTGYGSLMDAAGRSLPEFLASLPNFHTRIAMLFPELKPPRFEVSDSQPGSLRLRYYTHRAGLAPFVEGLLSGLGKRFGTPVSVHREHARSGAGDPDIFRVEWTA